MLFKSSSMHVYKGICHSCSVAGCSIKLAKAVEGAQLYMRVQPFRTRCDDN